MPDEDGYPTKEELERIRTWRIRSQADLDALWAFCKALWYYPDRFIPWDGEKNEWTGDATWYVSTGGWSGNEDVIDALECNPMFWSLCFRLRRVGGHFLFRIEGFLGEAPPS